MTITDPSLPLPRILCLHGGGTNSEIFKIQLKPLLSHPSISSRFRFVFCEAPFTCDAGNGVSPVFDHLAPFARWSRWLKSHATIDAEECHGLILTAIKSAMIADEGTGEWIGVLGFSQGAKVACSLLLLQQLEAEAADDSLDRTVQAEFKFGIIMAGRAPLLALTEQMEGFKWLQSAAGLPNQADMDALYEMPECRLKVPTLHVHGLRDEGLHLHRRCVEDYCAPGTTSVVEWDGGHRLVVKSKDVESVAAAITGLADEYGY